MRTLVIGDVHSCLDELRALIMQIGYDPSCDQLVFLGDLIDRGPDPVGVVEYVRQLHNANPRVCTVVGNHDEKAYRYLHKQDIERAGGKRNPMALPDPVRLKEWESQGESNRKWLETLPVFTEPLPGWLAVHAGFEADKPLSEQKPDKMMRVRFLDPVTGKMKPYVEGTLDQPVDSVMWMEMWSGPQNVVYGHAVHSLDAPRVDRINGVECWGIDTGCVFGGHLTALELETRQVFQVKAARAYSERIE